MWRRLFGSGKTRAGDAQPASSAPVEDDDLDEGPFEDDEEPDFGAEIESAGDEAATDPDQEQEEGDEAAAIRVRLVDTGAFIPQADEAMPSFEERPALSREEYEMFVGELPMPRKRQMRDFAAYVAAAKDWHEDLPLLPDGAAFRFYLDPFAGMERVLMPDATAAFVERPAAVDGFDAWIPTTEYRERFGVLSFACSAGACFVKPVRIETGEATFEGTLDNNFNYPVVWVPRKPFGLPEPIVRVGTCLVTGVVHPRASHPAAWRTTLEATTSNHAWPAETGGPSTLAAIRARCEARGMADEFDAELDALLAPERQRLLDEMVAAMARVLAQIHGAI